MPMTAWTPVPETAHEIAADRSPSLMSLIRAPASRTSAISASWRGRSRMTTVMSRDLAAERPRDARRGSRSGSSRMSTWPAATGPTHSFSMYVSGAWVRPPASDAARTVIAPAWPWATRFVPSSGSTAMSTRGTSSRSAPRPADPLADVEHRRLVALALADDDPAGEVDLVHRLAHRLGGGLVGAVALAASHEPRRLDGGGLGDPDHLERRAAPRRSCRAATVDAAISA